MPPAVGSLEERFARTFSSEEDKQRASSASQENGTPRSKQRWRWRGLIWRVNLGVLPPITSSIEDLRRASADGRRRYAEYRRRLLVDPHLMEEGQAPPYDLNMDNPLSLNPDSVWGRFFQNVELERTIDKDLARLYPEHGSYFQGQSCQSMLRRVLLVWSLIHPQCSYRQGMHELLAPFLYVLNVDLERLSHMKGRYEDHFDDGFTRTSIQPFSIDLMGKSRTSRNIQEIGTSSSVPDFSQHILQKDIADFFNDVEEFDTDVAFVLMGSDMYGAEGELGSLLSVRFLEHDAYCMLDALMSGQGGAFAMADYFISSPGAGSSLAIPPVIEASAALYRTLAAADISLYAHLVEMGVEPQFFALRWLRLLFGREFLLEDLLLVWDAIFAASNEPFFMEPGNAGNGHFYGLKHSPRSAFIYALAVSMLLYLRPALLAAPDATGCLQRLLNFPEISDVRSLIENAKLLQCLAEAAAKTTPLPIPRSARLNKLNKALERTRSGSISPPTSNGQVGLLKSSILKHQTSARLPDILRSAMPESYWEERWKSWMSQHALVDEALGKHSEVIGPNIGSQQQPIGDSNSSLTKEEGKLPAAEPSSFSENVHEDDKVPIIRGDADGNMTLASNGSSNDGFEVTASSSSMQMPGNKQHHEIVNNNGKDTVPLYNAQVDRERRNESCVKSIGNGPVHEAQFTSIDKNSLDLQEHENSLFGPWKINVNFDEENAKSVLTDVQPFTRNDQEQATPNSVSPSSGSEDLLDKRVGVPSHAIPGYTNNRDIPEEERGSPPSEGLTSEFLERSLKSRAAWVYSLDKLNPGERSLKLQRETMPSSASAQQAKYMWDPGSLESEADFCANAAVASRVPGKQATDHIILQAEVDTSEIEAQYDSVTRLCEDSRKDKDNSLIVQLQAYGLSMMGHIQVLELALNTGRLETKNHTNCPHTDEGGESSANPTHGSGGNVAIMVALAELHKIGNFLQQL